MAAAPSGGILAGISNVLQNPAVQELLPAVLGAAGGVLTAPRRGGVGGSIGRGLLGGAQGLEEGQKAALEQQRASAEQQKLPGDLQETAARTNLIQTQTKTLQNQLDNQAVFAPAFKEYLESHVKDPATRARLGMMATTDPKGALTDATLEATKDINIGLIARAKGLKPEDLAGLDAAEAKDLAVKTLSGDKFQIEKINTSHGVVLASINKTNPNDVTYTTTGLKEQPNVAVNFSPFVDSEGNVHPWNNRSGTAGPAVPGVSAQPKGGVTDAGTEAALHNQWTKEGGANEAAKALYDRTVGVGDLKMPGAKDFVPPFPNYNPDFSAWQNSPEGQSTATTYKGGPGPTIAAAGAPKTRGTESGAPVVDLSKAPPPPAGASGPAVGRATKLADGPHKSKSTGKMFIVKGGYVYPMS